MSFTSIKTIKKVLPMGLSVYNVIWCLFGYRLAMAANLSRNGRETEVTQYIGGIMRNCGAINPFRYVVTTESLEIQAKNIDLPYITNLETYYNSRVLFEPTKKIILIRFRLLEKIKQGNGAELKYLVRKYAKIMESQNFRVARIDKLMSKLRDMHSDNQPAEIIDAIISWIKYIQEKLLISDTNISNLGLILKKIEVHFYAHVYKIILENNDTAIINNNLNDIIGIFLKISNIYIHINSVKNIFGLENMNEELKLQIKNVWNNVHTDYKLYHKNLKIMLKNKKSYIKPIYNDICMSTFFISLCEAISQVQYSHSQVIRSDIINSHIMNSVFEFVNSTGVRIYCYSEIITEELRQLFGILLVNSRLKHDKVRKDTIILISGVLDELRANIEGLVIFIRSINLYKHTDIAIDDYRFDKCNRILQLLKSYFYFLVHDVPTLELSATYDYIYSMNFICFEYYINTNYTLYIDTIRTLLNKCSEYASSTISMTIKYIINCYIEQNTSENNSYDERMYQNILSKTIDVFNRYIGQTPVIEGNKKVAMLNICYKFKGAFEYLNEYAKVQSSSDKYIIFRTIGDTVHSIIFNLYHDIRAFEGINNNETVAKIQRFCKDFDMRFICSFSVAKDSPNCILIYKFMMTLIMYINETENEFGDINDSNLRSILAGTTEIMSKNNFSEISFIEESLAYIISDCEQRKDEWKFKFVFLGIFKKFKPYNRSRIAP